MAEEAKKTNTGLIIGIAAGAVVAIVAIVVLIIVLTKGGAEGTYKLYAQKIEGKITTVEEAKEQGASEEDTKGEITLNGDGTCKMVDGNKTQDCTWDKDKKTIAYEGGSVEYELNGSELTLKYSDNLQIIFKK